MNQFKELKVWQEAIDLAVETYKITKQFPADERFNLISQMNRSAVSISSNIAEGCGRNNPKEFRQFLGIAQGSACELESQMIISQKLDFLSEANLMAQTQRLILLQNMTNKLMRTL